ncbi:cupin domain-containing protein [Paraliobacillus sediminis]|uniref:cupin domain-containing protein n=1 Tax=Paraliobacillus sediminis TaxID=1885916 RepID=UPI000E3C34EB|nr:cupin domain-containing protein [Paraliobacillus sediminis]
MKRNNINEFMEFTEEKLTKRVIIKEGKTTVFILNFKPGQSLPAHKHPGSNVQLLVLEGNGEFNIDGETVVVEKNDTVFIGGDEELAFLNTGTKNVSLYVVLNNIPDDRYAKNI